MTTQTGYEAALTVLVRKHTEQGIRISELLDKNEKLQQQVKEMREALEWYGNADNWRKDEFNHSVLDSHLEDDEDDFQEHNCFVGGKLARACLAKYKGEK